MEKRRAGDIESMRKAKRHRVNEKGYDTERERERQTERERERERERQREKLPEREIDADIETVVRLGLPWLLGDRDILYD
jgi:hypothetical protein